MKDKTFEKILFSVVIPTYNRKVRLRRSLESVACNNLSQSEVIVVDDGSTDGSGTMVSAEFPWVKYLVQSNQGVASARNTGMKAAKGLFIAFLDSDDIWYATRLDVLAVAVSGLPPDVGLVFNDMDRLSMDGGDGVSYSDEYFGIDKRRVIKQMTDVRKITMDEGKLLLRVGCVFDGLLQGNIISPPCAILRRDVFLEIGGFREDFRVANDAEYFLRVAGKYRVGYIPEILTTIEPPRREGSLSCGKNNIEKIDNMIAAIDQFQRSKTFMHTSRVLLKKRVAGLYALKGYQYLTDLERVSARQQYRQAILIDPFQLKNYFLYVLTQVPMRILSGMGQLKRMLKNRMQNG